MPARDQNRLTDAEQQALALIREIRRQTLRGELPGEFREPARLAHYVIARYHGHVQLRMSRIAPEIGATPRTLERSFHRVFSTTMKKYQIEMRLRFARYLLAGNPDLKVSVIANQLGYDDANAFGRFFRDHTGESPHAWSEAERARRLRGNPGGGASKGIPP